MEFKKPWASRTTLIKFILAILAAVAFVIPQAEPVVHWIEANDALIAAVWGLAHVLVGMLAGKDDHGSP